MRKILPFLILFSFFWLASAFCSETKVCVKDACVQAEIADTLTQRDEGLMYRTELAEGRGMLFIFEIEDIYSFWMKNMQIPLDMIWINGDNVIVDIKAKVPPCTDACDSLTPANKAKYVLEVSSGFCERHSIVIGDRVDLGQAQ